MAEHPLSYAPAGVGSSPEVAARTETYLGAGRRGKNTWWRYLLGFVFVVFMWFVVGGRASLLLGNVLGISPGQVATDASATGPIAGYLVISASFPVFLLGSVLAVTFLHRRSPLTLVTGRRSINWGRVETGLGVWFALAVVASLVGFLLDSSAFSLGSNLAAFVPAYSLIQFLVAATIFYVVVFVLFKRRTKKGP